MTTPAHIRPQRNNSNIHTHTCSSLSLYIWHLPNPFLINTLSSSSSRPFFSNRHTQTRTKTNSSDPPSHDSNHISLLYIYQFLSPLSFSLPAMITLFKKNIHSFLLALPSNTTNTTTKTGELQCQPISSSSSSSGLGIMSATRDRDRPPNVVESAMLKPSSSPPLPPPSSSPNNMIRSNIGFIDEIGGEVDGLMSCTESLGFESSDERRVDINTSDNIHHEKVVNDRDWRSRSRRGGERRKARSFPPPLRSLNRNGEPSFFLRPVRKDGRLELTEVRIHRPQILHAERHHGRLTLLLIPDHHSIDLQEEEEEEKVAQEQVEEQVVVEEEAHEEVEEQVRVEEEEEEEEEIGYDENEEDGRFGEWRFENEGLRRCHEMVNQHQHQHHHGVHGSHIHHHHHHHMRMCGISIV